MKDLKITPPEGYEIDKNKSTLDHIYFKEKIEELPRAWEELKNITGWYINKDSKILKLSFNGSTNLKEDRNLYPTRELAEAGLALIQLLQLRDNYNDGWVPDWNGRESKSVIIQYKGEIKKENYVSVIEILAFKNELLRNEFFENFKDLLETAKPLL